MAKSKDTYGMQLTMEDRWILRETYAVKVRHKMDEIITHTEEDARKGNYPTMIEEADQLLRKMRDL